MRIIDTPLYLYGNLECPSPNDGALFHFTKFESLLKILETMTLRSSSLSKMNDLNEANIDDLDWEDEFLRMIEVEKYIKEKCSVICFTKNYKTGPICQEGSNHPALWAHYAQDSNGACIVLDKHVLLGLNRRSLNGVFHRTGVVRYCHRCAPSDSVMERKGSSVSEFVRNNYKELFFKKHNDWKYEKEVRFFVESPEVYLNIKGAIKYIILGERLSDNDEHLLRLIRQIITPGTLSYHYLVPGSFAEMKPSPYGYFTGSAAHLIERVMGKISILSKDYIDWERSQFRRG